MENNLLLKSGRIYCVRLNSKMNGEGLRKRILNRAGTTCHLTVRTPVRSRVEWSTHINWFYVEGPLAISGPGQKGACAPRVKGAPRDRTLSSITKRECVMIEGRKGRGSRAQVQLRARVRVRALVRL